MRQSTIDTITAIVKADPEATPEHLKNILAACKAPITSRRMILAKKAMEILEVSRPTLRRWAEAGKLTEIKPSPRKTRYYLDEIERLKYNGVQEA